MDDQGNVQAHKRNRIKIINIKIWKHVHNAESESINQKMAATKIASGKKTKSFVRDALRQRETNTLLQSSEV